MAVYTMVCVECDECGNDEADAPPKKKVIANARRDGWRIGKVTLCPECADRKAGRE